MNAYPLGGPRFCTLLSPGENYYWNIITLLFTIKTCTSASKHVLLNFYSYFCWFMSKSLVKIFGALYNATEATEPGIHRLLLFLCRNCTSSSEPPGLSSGPRSLRAVSAAQAYAKLMQERSLGDFKTSQLLFINQLQENPVKDQEQLRKQVCPYRF